MSRKEETKSVLLRVPLDVKAWIEKEAAPTLESQNSVILRCIRARMENERRPEGTVG
jgi:hypothetical protein